METSKILSADLLDLLFDERNKDYGAYELRRTYHKRIKRALVATFSVAGLIIAGSVLASNMRPPKEARISINEVTIQDLTQEEPEEIPPPEKEPEPVTQERTEQFVNIVIAPTEEVTDPPPTQDDLSNANIGNQDLEGVDPDDVVEPPLPEVQKGIVDVPEKEPDVWTKVEVEAKYEKDWARFLTRNLRADVPVENGAPAGRHTVIIQFVVDVDGSLSDFKALTNVGFGMEEEAIRVLKKSDKWTPAFQNTKHVKAYRRQPITFEVVE